MDLPDNILEELEYLDNITSCNKVENCLMLSEYEQNLIKEKEWPQSVTAAYRRARKWSLVRQSSSVIQGGHFSRFTSLCPDLELISVCANKQIKISNSPYLLISGRTLQTKYLQTGI